MKMTKILFSEDELRERVMSNVIPIELEHFYSKEDAERYMDRIYYSNVVSCVDVNASDFIKLNKIVKCNMIIGRVILGYGEISRLIRSLLLLVTLNPII
jgi:hypothetical protein